MRRATIWAALLGMAIAMPATAAEEPSLVGALGEVSRLEFQGVVSFSERSIRQELEDDFQVIVASDPGASLDAYLSLLELKIRDGYRDGGFRDATAQADVDLSGERICIQVDEGPRFTAGKILIQTSDDLLANRLRVRLLAKGDDFASKHNLTGVELARARGEAASKAAVWKNGEPIKFRRDADPDLTKKVREALDDLGYEGAQFAVRVEADPLAEHEYNLCVEITETGISTEPELVTVYGCRKNSAVEVLEYLGLVSGETRGANCQELRDRLWASGRFMKHEVSRVPQLAAGRYELRIELQEYDKAPPLRQPLSTEEQIMLKCRDWLAAWRDREEDLVVRRRFAGHEVEAAISRGDTVAVEVDGHYGLIDAARLLYVDKSSPGKIDVPLGPSHPQVTLGIIPSSKYPAGDSAFVWSLGGYMDNMPDEESNADCIVAVNLAPVAFVGMLHEWDAESSLVDGVLTLESDREFRRIAAESGAVLEWRLFAKDDAEGASPTHITFERGRCDALRGEIESLADGRPNDYREDAPLRSTLGRFAEKPQVLAWLAKCVTKEGQDPERRRVALRLCSHLLLGFADEAIVLLRERETDERTKFHIPGATDDLPQSGPAVIAAWCGPTLAHRAFPRGSWASTLTRASTFALAAQPHFAHEEMKRLSAAAPGPLAAVTTAYAFRAIGAEEPARTVSRQGTERISLDEFRADYRPLLDPSAISGRVIATAAGFLRGLGREEMEMLAEPLPERYRPLVVGFCLELNRDQQRSIDEALPAALDWAWSNGLAEEIRGELVKGSHPPRPAPSLPGDDELKLWEPRHALVPGTSGRPR